MKRTLQTLLALTTLLTTPAFASPPEGAITKAERTYLLQQLESSKAAMLASIKGLTPAQWNFKPAPEVWSVAECAEHIILAEDTLFGMEQKVLATPATPRLANATPEGDRAIVAQAEDRSVKAQANAPVMPTGNYPTPQSAAAEFIKRRAKTIAYVKTTQDQLRIHSGPGPLAAPADPYQFLLVLAAHSARHTAQIHEVQANLAYPKTKPTI
jgi:DinB superfamily